ncbi:uncharacterized protein LOC118646821 [Monomorium pharaonis]|uniref:uncharacterized protein LOC118646821 n=1 Tax=Monomorium pharaonis TaxID=307658 RepID=UPI0017461745|nr:uncharacterized protein LOC118646821 [Monomorium pharaonis]
MATDIEKMYRQILVAPEDRDFQRILWRHSPSDSIREYRLNTVTYGLACAPFLAIRTLRQLADDEETRFPRGAAVLRRDCYVDDIVTGAHSKQDAVVVQKELRQLCTAGGFPLRKWSSNCPDILVGIPSDHCLLADSVSWKHEGHATLGLHWYPAEDAFSFSIKQRSISNYTKSSVLAETARLFDPLGWLAPVVIQAKILIQSTWLQNLEWNAPLHPGDVQQWQQFFQELPQLASIRVGRWVSGGDENSEFELHGFADASERGYAAVAYLRVAQTDGVRLHLLAAKTKVAPIKPISLPRLELCAASLLSDLIIHVRNTLSLFTAPVILWSDSKVTFDWIRGHASRWKTYVANRVSRIQEFLSEASWRHVPGRNNPADCAFRGISPSELFKHPLWWTGPCWFSKDRTE